MIELNWSLLRQKPLSCDLIYDPLCFARLWQSVTVVGFQYHTKQPVWNVDQCNIRHLKIRFNETTAHQRDFFAGWVCPGGHLIEESSVALWPQGMAVWGRGRVCCQPDIPEFDTFTLSLSTLRSIINMFHNLCDTFLILAVSSLLNTNCPAAPLTHSRQSVSGHTARFSDNYHVKTLSHIDGLLACKLIMC